MESKLSKNNSLQNVPTKDQKDKQLWRDVTAFWILGLCNNFGYNIMLSAAHDINASFENTNHKPVDYNTEPEALHRQCNIVSTGAILLADIIPGLVAKIIFPFFPFWVNARVFLVVLLMVSSFLLVGFANEQWMAILGVAFTSSACGLGESTILAFTPKFHKNTLSAFSSGTGGAGLFGSLSYAGLCALGLSSRTIMLIMLSIPLLESFAFWILLRKPTASIKSNQSFAEMEDNEKPLKGYKEKLFYIKSLLKYMFPLFFVFFLEYFINQGLFELVYFEDTFLNREAQYRWFCVDYQLGVFISRSSVNLVQIKQIWIFPLFQLLNVIYFMTEAIYFYSPNIWIPFVVVLWEGLLGGAAYINTFYKITKEVPKSRQKFAIGVAVQADSLGVMLAGFMALPAHNAICRMPLHQRMIW